MRGRSPRGWLFTEVYVALRSLVRQRMTEAMHAADRIHHKSMPLPQASELCFQCIPTPTPPVVQQGFEGFAGRCCLPRRLTSGQAGRAQKAQSLGASFSVTMKLVANQ